MNITRSLFVECCPLCAEDHARAAPFNRRVDCGVEWRYYMCRHCGLVYQSPQMTDEELARFYGDDYWKTQGQIDAPDEEQVRLQQGRAEHLTGIVPSEHKVRRFLDIGCAAGFLLREAKRRFAADVVGIELSDPFRAYCRGQGHTVYRTVDELLAAGEDKFDCITMSHVLEHLRDPVAFLMRLRRDLLRPTGLLALEVPNLYAHNSFEAGHPICFNEKTLRAALTKAGFATQKLLIHNHPRYEIRRPLYISALAAPTASAPILRFDPPNVWRERVKRAYTNKGGPWFRRVLKGARIGALSLFKSDLRY